MTKLVFAVVVCCLLSGASAQHNIQTEFRPNYITEGENATQGEFPYHIHIIDDDYPRPVCSGALVVIKGQHLIITTATCVHLRRISVVAGDLDILDKSGFEQTRRAASTHIHPFYNAFHSTNDIAVLKIACPFDLNKNVSPIPLPKREQQTTGKVISTGWNYDEYGNTNKLLQKADLPVMDDSVCPPHLDMPAFLPSMICGYYMCQDTVNKSSDWYLEEGSPLLAVEYLAGLTGWTVKCTVGGTEISYFIDWINSLVD